MASQSKGDVGHAAESVPRGAARGKIAGTRGRGTPPSFPESVPRGRGACTRGRGGIPLQLTASDMPGIKPKSKVEEIGSKMASLGIGSGGDENSNYCVNEGTGGGVPTLQESSLPQRVDNEIVGRHGAGGIAGGSTLPKPRRGRGRGKVTRSRLSPGYTANSRLQNPPNEPEKAHQDVPPSMPEEADRNRNYQVGDNRNSRYKWTRPKTPSSDKPKTTAVTAEPQGGGRDSKYKWTRPKTPSSDKPDTTAVTAELQVVAPPTKLVSTGGVDCICFRPLKRVMCCVCGYMIMEGRVRKMCALHPREIYLLDVTACPNPDCGVNAHYLTEKDFPPSYVPKKTNSKIELPSLQLE